MSYISLSFALLVAAALLLYFIVPVRYRWTVLLAASYLFLWFNGKKLVLILWCTTFVTFLIGLWIQKVSDAHTARVSNPDAPLSREEKKKSRDMAKKTARRILRLGIALVLGSLLFFKYFNFFGSNVSAVLSIMGIRITVPKLNLLIPLGISYYTLQAISYMVDVYRGKIRADRNPARFMLFMSFFPQILQGPIPRYSQLAGQLYEGHRFDAKRVSRGAQLILWGLIKKLLIAERLAVPVGHLFGNYAKYSGPILFLAAVMYGLQVYTDFSGGMDIARGIAQMFGIDLELNFRQPYYSASIEDFWRRWHITMGSWMKDYIFYPLSLSKAFTGLSRKSRKVLGQFVGKRLPAFLAMFIVYFCVGFWHGANWKYVAYGVWNGSFIMISILLEKAYAKGRTLCGIDENSFSWRLFRRIRTLIIVSFGRFFTGSANLSSALGMFRQTFRNWQDISFITNGALLKTGLNNANWILLCLLIALLFYVDYKHERGISFREVFARQHVVFRWGIYIAAILAVLVFGYYGPAYNAASFVYGQF